MTRSDGVRREAPVTPPAVAMTPTTAPAVQAPPTAPATRGDCYEAQPDANPFAADRAARGVSAREEAASGCGAAIGGILGFGIGLLTGIVQVANGDAGGMLILGPVIGGALGVGMGAFGGAAADLARQNMFQK